MRQFDYVHLGLNDYPEWFTLDLMYGVDPAELPLDLPPVPLLVIGFAEEPFRHILDVLPKLTWLAGYQERLKEYDVTTNFHLDVDKPWGFSGILNPYRRTKSNGLREYAVVIPQIEKDAGECENCEGSGITDDDWECFHCSKTGRETMHDWDSLDCIAATFSLLFQILEMPDKKWLAGITNTPQQLLTVRTNFERGRAFIGATLSRTLCDYLRSHSNKELPTVKGALKRVYERMFPSYQRFDDYSYRADIRNNGQLILDVPGNACGLYVDGSLREASGPIELHCHNVDGHHQQTTLLCGLAALSGMIRRELYRTE